MGRLLPAGVLVASTIGIASAGPTRKVRVETSPAGATVYIDSIENGPACDATPCSIDAPLGESNLIIQLTGHQPEFVPIDVSKRGRIAPISVKLKSAMGTLVIDAPRGAKIYINDEEKGTGSQTLEVPAEPVRVVVKLAGKTLYDDFIEIENGQSRDLKVKAAGTAGTTTGSTTSTTTTTASAGSEDEPGGDDDGDEDPLGGDSGEDDGGEVAASATSAPRQPFVQAGLAFDVGFRRFAFVGTTNTFNNGGEVLVGPAIELWPGRLLGVAPLRNLSLFTRFQFSLVHQQVTNRDDNTAVGAETFWGALEVSLRQKWTFGRIGLELSGGFVRDQVEFSAPNQTVLMQVPSADYQSIRLGGRVSYVGRFEPFLSAENRFVLSGGELAKRADASDTAGYRVAAGVATAFGKLGLRAEASLTRYNWAFAENGTVMPPSGTANDSIYWLGLVGGYQY